MKKRRISQSFQNWLLLLVVTAFLVTTGFLWIFQTQLSKNNAYNLLELNIADVHADITDSSDENLLRLTNEVAHELNALDEITVDDLVELEKKYDVSEINCINPEGYIYLTT